MVAASANGNALSFTLDICSVGWGRLWRSRGLLDAGWSNRLVDQNMKKERERERKKEGKEGNMIHVSSRNVCKFFKVCEFF